MTSTRPLADILADLEYPPSPAGTGWEFYRELELAVRAKLARPSGADAPPAGNRLQNALDQAETALGGDEFEMRAALIQLADLVHDQLDKAGPAEADALAAEAAEAARTMAPPVPGVTVNAGYVIQAVMPGHPAEPGLLQCWYVAAERRRAWVTWEAYMLDGERAGFLAYNAGHYFTGPDQAVSKRAALADLAVRAGTMPEIARRIADDVVRYHPEHGPWTLIQKRERQLAGALRTWAVR